jgi:hypothetical protein
MKEIQANVVSCRLMNILIEDAESLEYLTSGSQWTKNVAKAKDFGTTRAALAIAKKEPIGKFNIVRFILETNQFINLDHGRGKGTAEVAAVQPEAVLPIPATT